MTKATLYLDLDGVFADFELHFLEYFGIRHDSVSDEEMWKMINGYPQFFANLPLMPGAATFYQLVRWRDPIVLTACPRSNYANVARLKRQWARKHLDTDIYVLPVLGGKNKALFMHMPGDILIDDFEKNIRAWNEEGGRGILHKDFNTTWQRYLELTNV